MEKILTLTGLLKRTTADFPARRALSVSGKFDLTHSRLQELIDDAAHKLLASGVRHGHVVALTFPNTVESVVMFLAVIRCGAVAAPLNAAYTANEFEFYLSDSESKLLVTNVDGNKAAQAAASKLNIAHVTAELPSAATEEVVLSPSPEKKAETLSKLVINDPSDVALFLYTSGTTSRPKGVPLTQLNLASSVLNIKSVYKLSENDATVIVLPLFHVHGLLAGLLSSLVSGGAVTLPAAGRFSATTFWSDMNKYKATWYTAVPTIHQIILDRHLNNPEPDEYPKLRFITSCSASLAPSILARLEEAFKAPVLEAYAMTEASHLMCSNPLPEDGPHKLGSVGKPVGQELAILDENGVVQGHGKNGEVCIRGANVAKGLYKNNPEANKSAYQFGWFHTGDIGFLDEDGYLHLVGRIKELVNRGGEKISPIEVDAVLLSHQDVAQTVFFGVSDDKYGEEEGLRMNEAKDEYAANISSIRDAHDRIKLYINKTPVLTSQTLNSMAGLNLSFKCECFQKCGAFKFRGACNAVFSLTDEQAAKGVVTHSSGNHAAALSLAAQIRGIPAYIIVPKNAPQCKVDNVNRYGGKVILSEPTMRSRERTAAQVMQDTGSFFVHSSNNRLIISGQGTVALELLDEVPQLDTIIVPISGGGLISGVALAAKAINPAIRVIAAEPKGADDAAQSKAAGRIITLPQVHTIADGLRANLDDLTWPVVRDLVDGIVTVTDQEIVKAMKLCYEVLKVAVEPSGAIGLAAVLSDSFQNNPSSKGCNNVGIIISGGNVDLGVLWDSLKN